MISYISVAALLGIIATIWSIVISKDKSAVKSIIKWIAYTVIINGIILMGLRLIGLQDFWTAWNGIRFKAKYICLGVIFALFLPYAILNIRSLTKENITMIWKKFLPVNLFLTVTYAIFIPSSLVVGNMGEFRTGYIMLIPLLVIVAIMLLGGIYVLELLFVNKTTGNNIYAMIFGITFGMYIQSNFLNPEFPLMDGAEFDWSIFNGYLLVSSLVWVIVIIGSVLFIHFFNERAAKVMRYVALFFCLVQIVSLIPTVLMNQSDGSEDYVYTLDGEFSLGSEKNIVLFIVDTMQADALRNYLDSEAYEEGSLDDFIFYSNGVSGAAPTEYAIPLLLSGIEYDPEIPFYTYCSQIWDNSDFLKNLYQDGYDIRLYTETNMTPQIPSEWISNYGKRQVEHIKYYAKFGTEIFKLTNLNVAPQIVKKSLWMSTDEIVRYIRMLYSGYRLDDVELYKNWSDAEKTVTVDYEKTFRMIHLQGAHAPYLMSADCEAVDESESSEAIVIQGSFKMITEYIKAMKATGVYDQSTIVILGDHGRHEKGNLEANSAILVKEPCENHKIQESTAPVTFRNVVATMAKNDRGNTYEFGPALTDMAESSDVERFHTVTKWVCERAFAGTDIKYDDSVRFIVEGNANVLKSCVEWKPKEYNRLDYILGDKIDFTVKDTYTDQIDFGIRKQEDGAILKNEFSVCFALQQYQNEDLQLVLETNKIYGKSQKALIYINGNIAGNLEFSNGIFEYEITIPNEYIKTDEIVLRIVFPGAVTPRMLDQTQNDDRVCSIDLRTLALEPLSAEEKNG